MFQDLFKLLLIKNITLLLNQKVSNLLLQKASCTYLMWQKLKYIKINKSRKINVSSSKYFLNFFAQVFFKFSIQTLHNHIFLRSISFNDFSLQIFVEHCIKTNYFQSVFGLLSSKYNIWSITNNNRVVKISPFFYIIQISATLFE